MTMTMMRKSGRRRRRRKGRRRLADQHITLRIRAENFGNLVDVGGVDDARVPALEM
jgi:hypothetical protein